MRPRASAALPARKPAGEKLRSTKIICQEMWTKALHVKTLWQDKVVPKVVRTKNCRHKGYAGKSLIQLSFPLSVTAVRLVRWSVMVLTVTIGRQLSIFLAARITCTSMAAG